MSERSIEPTPQEVQALRAVVQHGTIRAAARALGLSPHTIDAHLDNLRSKSGLRYLPQLVAWGAAQGWLQVVGKHDPEE